MLAPPSQPRCPHVHIQRTALVLHTPMDMFRLVQDVARYPEFLSWCLDAEVLERTEHMQLARLHLSLAGLRPSFTTRNTLEPGRRLTMALVEGPFSDLSGEWRFEPLGEAGCKITLDLSFRFSSRVLSAAFERGFAAVADRLVSDFSRRADVVYGAALPAGSR